MYARALQGYEDALGLKVMSSHIPALNTMFNLGNLFSELNEKGMAKTMYNRALTGFATIQGPSSRTCRELKRLLDALDLAPAELES